MGWFCNWSYGINLNYKWNFNRIIFIKDWRETLCYNGWVNSNNNLNFFAWIFGICWQLKSIFDSEFYSINIRRIWGRSKFYSKYGNIKFIWFARKRIIYRFNRSFNWCRTFVWSSIRFISFFGWGLYFSICKFRYV
jgi:hypothetical protein